MAELLLKLGVSLVYLGWDLISMRRVSARMQLSKGLIGLKVFIARISVNVGQILEPSDEL